MWAGPVAILSSEGVIPKVAGGMCFCLALRERWAQGSAGKLWCGPCSLRHTTPLCAPVLGPLCPCCPVLGGSEYSWYGKSLNQGWQLTIFITDLNSKCKKVQFLAYWKYELQNYNITLFRSIQINVNTVAVWYSLSCVLKVHEQAFFYHQKSFIVPISFWICFLLHFSHRILF